MQKYQMQTVLFLASATILYCTCTYFDEFDDHDEAYFRNLRRTDPEELNLNETFFPQLINYSVGGQEVEELEFPWIAKVIHSTINSDPYICTAVCIEPNIFISAARCVYILKVIFTSLIYQKQRLTVKALVLPSQTTKQLYDDIGFIITNDKFVGKWHTIKIYDEPRTDNVFAWFRAIKFELYDHKIVGFASPKSLENVPMWYRPVQLMQLDVHVGIDLCRKILCFNNLISGFNVPCYHSCSVNMYKEGNKTCKKYHGVEGGALVNKQSNQLLGIATWGANNDKYELPVGFSVPNSKSFYEDLKCASKIQKNKVTVSDGFYQKLCDSPLHTLKAERKYY